MPTADDQEFDALVGLVRSAFVWPVMMRFSDDMDDWLANAGMETYTERQDSEVRALIEGEKKARRALMRAGPGALPAVRRGLRLSGKKWRMVLLDFMKKHGGAEEDREVLRLISVRRRDPLADPARKLLAKWGEDVTCLRPKRRTTQTASEVAHEKKLALLVAFCREPRKVRDMMKLLGLHTRRNFSRNYLYHPILKDRLVSTDATRGPLRDCYQATEAGLEWLKQQHPEIETPVLPPGRTP